MSEKFFVLSFVDVVDGVGRRYQIVKSALSWARGGRGGALDTGQLRPNTWYYLHMIKDRTTGVPDLLMSLEDAKPSVPEDYVYGKLIHLVKTTGTADIPLDAFDGPFKPTQYDTLL